MEKRYREIIKELEDIMSVKYDEPERNDVAVQILHTTIVQLHLLEPHLFSSVIPGSTRDLPPQEYGQIAKVEDPESPGRDIESGFKYLSADSAVSSG